MTAPAFSNERASLQHYCCGESCCTGCCCPRPWAARICCSCSNNCCGVLTPGGGCWVDLADGSGCGGGGASAASDSLPSSTLALFWGGGEGAIAPPRVEGLRMSSRGAPLLRS